MTADLLPRTGLSPLRTATNSIVVPDNPFKMTVPIAKALDPITVDGETHFFIAGLASGTLPDLDDEEMAASAIYAMQRAINEGIHDEDGNWSYVPLRIGHRNEWVDIIGWLYSAQVDEEFNLWIVAELDMDSPAGAQLYRKLSRPAEHGKVVKLGFSIHGKVAKAVQVIDQFTGRARRRFIDMMLDEVSVTSQPAYAPSYVETIGKSVNWDAVTADLAHKEQIMELVDNIDNVPDVAKATEKRTNDALSKSVAAAFAQAIPTAAAVEPATNDAVETTVEPAEDVAKAADTAEDDTDDETTVEAVAPGETGPDDGPASAGEAVQQAIADTAPEAAADANVDAGAEDADPTTETTTDTADADPSTEATDSPVEEVEDVAAEATPASEADTEVEKTAGSNPEPAAETAPADPVLSALGELTTLVRGLATRQDEIEKSHTRVASVVEQASPSEDIVAELAKSRETIAGLETTVAGLTTRLEEVERTPVDHAVVVRKTKEDGKLEDADTVEGRMERVSQLRANGARPSAARFLSDTVAAGFIVPQTRQD